jgi:hypothetical protein
MKNMTAWPNANGDGQPIPAKRGSGQIRKVLLGMALLGCVAAYFLIDDSRSAPSALKPPDIWAGAATGCPTSDKREAIEVAKMRLTAASARAERHAFNLSEGAEAVRLYGVAADCFRMAGLSERADDAAGKQAELKARIDMDYRIRTLRLEYAVRHQDKTTIAAEVRMLRQLLVGQSGSGSGPYLRSLDRLAREVGKEGTP